MKFSCKLLSNNFNEVNFYKIQGTGDSIFRENTKLYKDIRAEKIITTTLDHVISENGLPQPDFIKIDTQGSELLILQGGKIALNNTKLLVVEMPIVKFNLGAPKFNEILDFLEKFSFIPYDIVETHYLDNQLIQKDIIFVNHRLISLKDIKQNILNSI